MLSLNFASEVATIIICQLKPWFSFHWKAKRHTSNFLTSLSAQKMNFLDRLMQNNSLIMHSVLLLTVINEITSYILTSCHSVVYQEGGQSKRLQACTSDGLGLWHNSSAKITVSLLSLDSRWEQKTSRVCNPTPHVRLQVFHFPISHLWRGQERKTSVQNNVTLIFYLFVIGDGVKKQCMKEIPPSLTKVNLLVAAGWG